MKIPYFDAHCDTIGMALGANDSLRSNHAHIDLARGRELGRYAQVFALYDDVDHTPTGRMWDVCCALHDRLLHELAQNGDCITFCCTGAEIDAAVQEGLMAALLSIESADLLQCHIDRIETVAQWGTRLMNLTWNQANVISGSNARESDRGLSAYGRDFVRELEANNIYADVSHLSDAGFWDLVHMARQPIVASHSNARVLCPHPRNLTDDMFRAVRDSGGVVGINYYRPFVGGSGDLDMLVAHIEHFLALDGEKTVCFGGDMDGCDILANGIDGLQSIPKIYEALQRRGYSESLLEDLFWNNLRRMF
jgi:membrane dipeptidase